MPVRYRVSHENSEIPTDPPQSTKVVLIGEELAGNMASIAIETVEPPFPTLAAKREALVAALQGIERPVSSLLSVHDDVYGATYKMPRSLRNDVETVASRFADLHIAALIADAVSQGAEAASTEPVANQYAVPHSLLEC